jgi:ABC-2 type transport system ATP-binding protein
VECQSRLDQQDWKDEGCRVSLRLQADALKKSYGKAQALRGVSFALKESEFTVLLGPNGAGKSTLFQVLCGVFRPDSGTVLIDGLSLDRNPSAALAKLGVIFQQASLDLNMSIEQNLRFHAALHGMSRSATNNAIEQSLTQFGLSADAKRLARELSGGNRRKVELMRALMHKPSILLADEATVGLDPASRLNLMTEVKRAVTHDACSVLWATHLVEEASQADRVLVLHQGAILADSTPEGVRQQLGGDTLEQAFVHATKVGSTRKENS